MNKLWKRHEQVMDKLWTISEQVMYKSWTSHEQVKNKLNTSFLKVHELDLGRSARFLGWWVCLLRLRLSQPSLAGVGAVAELGNGMTERKGDPYEPGPGLSKCINKLHRKESLRAWYKAGGLGCQVLDDWVDVGIIVS